jgi:protein-L-isoaspartate(D-aspartate) O-methyltransferase
MEQPNWSAQRARMVREQIRARGIDDPRVLGAMERVPRERFVPSELRPHAYTDRALSIGSGQTISQPYMVAAMTYALQVEPHHHVLEIGTGSGYQAAVLGELVAEVYTVERVPELVRRACAILSELGYDNVHVREGDGSTGWPEHAPFQRILVAAGAPRTPPALLTQLDADDGRLVAPVGARDLQELILVRRFGNSWTTDRLMDVRFVPLLGEEGWDPPSA